MKADWQIWLHSYKRREVDRAFGACPEGAFDSGLELGAGDGFQGELLSRYVRRLVSTEINATRLSRQSGAGVTYRVCSAEEAVGSAADRSLDFVYSSNLLEHLRDPLLVLRHIHRIVKDDGITIHIVPARPWKLCHMLLFVPVNLGAIGAQVFRTASAGGVYRESRFLLGQLIDGVRSGANTMTRLTDRDEALTGNNSGLAGRRRTFFARLFFPGPHGVSASNLAELRAFGKRRWLSLFEETGFECAAVLNGPAASGYGLGWRWAETAVEMAGIAFEYIIVAHKKGHPCRYQSYFTGQGVPARPWRLRKIFLGAGSKPAHKNDYQ
jgi:SAM-dependent methyltransferase